MSGLTVELCPETSICSLVKPDGKTDLMPGEVADIRDANGDSDEIRQVIAEVDSAFAEGLSETELTEIAEGLKN